MNVENKKTSYFKIQFCVKCRVGEYNTKIRCLDIVSSDEYSTGNQTPLGGRGRRRCFDTSLNHHHHHDSSILNSSLQ